MRHIAIAGGSGLIGQHLTNLLLQNNNKVYILSRNPDKISYKKGVVPIKWNVEKRTIDIDKLKNINGIINLSGANLSEKRWTKKRKEVLYNSRVLSTRFLYEEVKKNNIFLDFFVSTSAIGYYGTFTDNSIFYEDSPNGKDFLALLCKDWEDESLKFKSISKRVVILRTGVVFSNKGGALPKIIFPIRYFVGGPIGSGKQIVPWIHIDDISRMFLFAIETNLNGIYNAVVSEEEQPNNKVLGQTIAKLLKKPFVFPNIPGFMLKLLLGEMAKLLLEGNKVSNKKILKKNFIYKYGQLEKALEDLL